MMPILSVAKFADKRIDEIVKKLGYNKAEIFYSPILAGLWYFALLLLVILPTGMIFWKFFGFQYGYFLFLGIFIVVFYLLNAFLNNSIVLTNDKIIIINPNFPFKRQTVIEIEEIRKITIESSKWANWFLRCFCIFSGNYIEITTRSRPHLFFCIHLCLERYGEHITEKTLDDLHFSLKKMSIFFVFNEKNLD